MKIPDAFKLPHTLASTHTPLHASILSLRGLWSATDSNNLDKSGSYLNWDLTRLPLHLLKTRIVS